MANKILSTRIIHKHDTEENWNKATNFIPLKGELIIYDVDNSGSTQYTETINYVNNLESYNYDFGDDYGSAAVLPLAHTPSQIVNWTDNSDGYNYITDVVIENNQAILLYQDIYGDNTITVTYIAAPSGSTVPRCKVGDGETNVNNLPFAFMPEDYIVEKGEYTNGDNVYIWEKWNSGKAVVHGYTITSNLDFSYSNDVIHLTGYTNVLNIPESLGLFVSKPQIIQVTCDSHEQVFATVSAPNSTKNTIVARMIGVFLDSPPYADVAFYVSCIGRWK